MRVAGRRFVLTLALAGAASAARAADHTVSASAGIASTASSPTPMVGLAWGISGEILGFDLEFAATPGKESPDRPFVATFGAFVFVQTPAEARDVQYYVGVGSGIYGETGEGGANTIGGGVRIPINRALKFSVDYRAFFVSVSDAPKSSPSSYHTQRLSAGISLRF